MTAWLADGTLSHLRDVAEWPDLGERYEVHGRLGRGGMGVVYIAHDRILERDVAVKVLDDLPRSADAARLLREARILGSLEHPGIVPVHDAGMLADGRVYYVMKLVRGERLDVAIRTRTMGERLDLFLRICEAVSFAHAQGIVHRDLKPQNIMLGAFGEVLVMDWGVAKSAESTTRALSDHAPEAAEIIGTPGYMAPEQERDAREADQRADVYALGVILDSLVSAPAPKPIAAIARRARAVDVEQRYDSVPALARDVMRFREGQPVSAYRETVLERLGRLYRRHKLPITLVLVYMLVRVILLLWLRT
jgi:predicted Ser/Thr protein kinase